MVSNMQNKVLLRRSFIISCVINIVQYLVKGPYHGKSIKLNKHNKLNQQNNLLEIFLY